MSSKNRTTNIVVDMTPSWEGLARLYADVLSDPQSSVDKAGIREELARMGRLADAYAAIAKAGGAS